MAPTLGLFVLPVPAWEPHTPRLVIERMRGTEVSRRYAYVTAGERGDIQCVNPGDDWNASGSLKTVTQFNRSGDFALSPTRIENPDGTVQVFEYQFLNEWRVNTVWMGEPDGSGKIRLGTVLEASS
jgi:hypothetical protein